VDLKVRSLVIALMEKITISMGSRTAMNQLAGNSIILKGHSILLEAG
jgi:hypothetical protein